MRRHSVDQFMYQTRIAMHITGRDTRKRIASMFMMIGVVIWSGASAIGLSIGALIIINEILSFVVVKAMPKGQSDKSIAIGLAFWGLNCTLILVYLSISIVLGNSPSIAFMIAGYLWLFGIYVHTSNSYSFLPFYNWSLMLPSFLVAFGLLYVSSNHQIYPASRVEWLVVAMLMVIYIVNTIETMDKHDDTQAALARARSELNSRLEELEHLTRHDKLTGLKNRLGFDEGLRSALLATKNLEHLSVFLIDLDDFKPINDSYSHLAGDAVLVAIANSLARIAGPDAIVARLGGDEFAAVIPDISSQEAALRLASYMIRAFNASVRFQEKQLRVGASIGIAFASGDLNKPSELLACADQAMYHAKADLAQKAVLYNPADFPVRATLEDRNALQRAIQEEQIQPYYQPKICLKSRNVVGFEALARWEHPQKGMLCPADFLPLVTEFGLHGDLLMKVAKQVLCDMDKMHIAGCDIGQMSINVPEVTLATLSGRAELSGLIAKFPHLRKNLTFEITEDVFIARAGEMIQRSIAFFRTEGIRVSLDDFGTGFASFQHLRVLEFDELKLDTAFVGGLGIDPAADILVKGFLAIGKGLGVQIVAEGVKTQSQVDLLSQMGCEVVQGHFFGAEMTATQAIELLHKTPECPMTSTKGAVSRAAS